MKICNEEDTGCDLNCMDCEIPEIEPEDCDDCKESSENAGIEYEANFTHVDGYWTCSNCGRGV